MMPKPPPIRNPFKRLRGARVIELRGAGRVEAAALKGAPSAYSGRLQQPPVDAERDDIALYGVHGFDTEGQVHGE